MATYKKILRAGMLMSGLLMMGSAVAPAVAQTSMEQGTTDRDDHGFDKWGLLGLVGLAGLLGRKRERNVVHTGRV